MQLCSREKLYTTHSAQNAPGLTVQPDETFLVDTELNSGSWFQSLQDEWHPSKRQGTNFTNCIAVQGAQPGQVLAVDILDIAVEEIAYTAFAGWRNELCQEIWPNDWDIVSRNVAVQQGYAHWSDRLKIPTAPMIGTLGVAPAVGVVSNAASGRYGGNMDVQELCPGTTLYLPVLVPNALLHVGDVHAIMGDGEINRSGGLECRSRLTLRTRLLPADPSFQWIRLENEEYIMAVACTNDMQSSFCQATAELMRWMIAGYGFTAQEAYLLLGQVLEARCTVLVSQEKPYICKIKKCYLTPET